MKRTVWLMLVIIAAITGLHAMKIRHSCMVSGRVLPAVDLLKILAISGRDTLEVPSREGSFRFLQEPGSCRLLVQAKGAASRTLIIHLEPGSKVRLGDIKLNN